MLPSWLVESTPTLVDLGFLDSVGQMVQLDFADFDTIRNLFGYEILLDLFLDGLDLTKLGACNDDHGNT